MVLIIDAQEGLFHKVQSAGMSAQNEDKKGKKSKGKKIINYTCFHHILSVFKNAPGSDIILATFEMNIHY